LLWVSPTGRKKGKAGFQRKKMSQPLFVGH
jgi:hypothetical protein